jgi:type IV pilus assembly protein PilC
MSKESLSAYMWSGINNAGKKVEGEVQAQSLSAAKISLKKRGISPSKIKKKAKPIFAGKAPKITPMDMAMVTRQIATMLGAGVSLIQTLEMISEGHDNASMRKLLQDVTKEVQAGNPLAKTIRSHPQYFDDLYCDLVDSGEQSGSLETIFDRIALYKEKAEALKSKIKKAMNYPIGVVVVAIAVTSILLIFVVPQFEEIFAGFGAELPAFTQLVIGISRFMQDYWYIFILVLFIGIYLFKKAHNKSQTFRDKVDAKLLEIPVLGMILNKAAVARYARTLATTFAAGVPLVEALQSAAGAAGNAVYRDAILEIRTEVSGGMQMNVAMKNTNVFPAMVTQMVSIGEESGAVDDMLNKVASIYEQQVDDAVDGLTALLEPLIMSVLGVVIGGLIIAMYLPIFQMGDVVG